MMNTLDQPFSEAPETDTAVPVVHVRVTVDADGKPVCTPDPVVVNLAKARLSFHLHAEAYVFPAEGAVVVSHPGSDFPHPAITQSPQRVTLLDCDEVVGNYAYTVTVQHVGTGRLSSVDPTITNEA